MICLLALIVFGVLGIFSATHRKIAIEAFDCVFRRVTLRKCESGLDKRLKGQITGNLMRKSPRLAKGIYKHFETISWAFTIVLVASLVSTGIGGYNYLMYGNCNGETSQEACFYEGISNTFNDPDCGSPSCQNTDCACEDEINCTETAGEECDGSCEG